MSPTKRFGAVFTALLGIAALAAVALHSTARGAKPPPGVIRPISYLTTSKSFDITVSDVSGSSSATVNREVSGHPRWSPDGQFIGGYLKSLGEGRSIMVMSPSGANELSILTEEAFRAWNITRPGVVGPTGFQIFSSNCWLGTDAIIFTGYEGENYTNNRLFIVDATGAIAPLTELAPHPGNDSDPHWSAALDKVVFTTWGELPPELYAINPDGTGLQQLTAFSGSVSEMRWPVWSPAGDRVFVCLRQGPASNWQLWILDVDFSQPNPGTGAGGRVTGLDPFKILDGQGGYPLTAAWSPDGQDIVFSRRFFDSRNRGSWELVIADAVSGAETVVKRSSSNIEKPDWSPVR